MSKVRHEGTTPELAVCSALDKLGVSFETSVRGLPGTPDILVRALNVPIFVHGCFWHRHASCRLASTPTRNASYWQRKFSENIARDERKIQDLVRLGYQSITIWQCQTKQPEYLLEILRDALSRKDEN